MKQILESASVLVLVVVAGLALRSYPAGADGARTLPLPAVDLPVSRTGLTLHHSPRYAVDPKPGAFRLENDPGPWSAALRAGVDLPPPPPPAPAAPLAGDRDTRDLKTLMDRFQKEAGRTRQGVIPLAITFPAVGPSVFLAAELTPETQSPSVDILYRRTGGR